MKRIEINSRVSIAEGELRFRFARSSGPGGQNVNKVNTKATLRWNVASSRSLSPPVRTLLMERLAEKITLSGDLVIQSQRYREQLRNIEDCRTKLVKLLRAALVVRKSRKPTRPSKASNQRRLTKKLMSSQKKQQRRPIKETD